MALNKDLNKNNWQLMDLSEADVDSWEPSYDTELWKEKNILDLYVQRVTQVDAEGKANIPPQPVQVLEWKPVSAGKKK